MTLPLPWTVVTGQSGEVADTQATYRLLMPAAEQAKVGVLAVDTFTRPDSATLDVAETGQSWELLAGTWSLTGQAATASVGGTAVLNVGTADQDVTALITPTTGAPGLVFRGSTTNSDRLTIQIDVTSSLFNLQKTVAGTTSSLVSATQTITPGVQYTVRVVAIDNSVTCYLDGTGVTLSPLTYTLSGPEQTQFGAYTRAGLRNTGSAAFDDFVVRYAYPGGGGGSSPTYANLPAGSTLTVQESGGSYTRPTSRTDLYVIFVGTSNPGAVALEGDLWAQTP